MILWNKNSLAIPILTRLSTYESYGTHLIKQDKSKFWCDKLDDIIIIWLFVDVLQNVADRTKLNRDIEQKPQGDLPSVPGYQFPPVPFAHHAAGRFNNKTGPWFFLGYPLVIKIRNWKYVNIYIYIYIYIWRSYWNLHW